MRRFKMLFYVYAGSAPTVLMRFIKHQARTIAEVMRRLARALALWGKDDTPHWSTKIFMRCYVSGPDAEIRIGTKVYRGPLRAMRHDFLTEDRLILSFDWFAEREVFKLGNPWKYHGQSSFLIKRYGRPVEITDKSDNTGDIWFSFEGGYATIYLGNPLKRLEFMGDPETPKTSAIAWNWKR